MYQKAPYAPLGKLSGDSISQSVPLVLPLAIGINRVKLGLSLVLVIAGNAGATLILLAAPELLNLREALNKSILDFSEHGKCVRGFHFPSSSTGYTR